MVSARAKSTIVSDAESDICKKKYKNLFVRKSCLWEYVENVSPTQTGYRLSGQREWTIYFYMLVLDKINGPVMCPIFYQSGSRSSPVG